MRQCIVTGGSGFIGQHLFRRLHESGAKVTLVNDLFQDIDQSDKLASAGPYEVFHLAGRVGVQSSWQEPVGFIETNVCGTARVLEFCRKSNSSLRFFSSPKSFESSFQKRKVENTSHAANPYLFSKDLAEQACQFFAMQYDVEVLVVRLFNVYGPGQNMKNLRQGMVSIFLEMAIKNKHIIVKGNTNRFRDFIFIDDVVDTFVECENNSNTFNKVYNVATGVKTNIKSLLKKIIQLFNYKITIEIKGSTPGDQFGIYADINSIRKDIDREPEISIDVGLKKMFTSVVKNE